MTTLFLATALALSCGKETFLPPNYEFGEPEISFQHGDSAKITPFKDKGKLIQQDLGLKQIVLGDTTLVFRGVKLHGAPVQDVDLNRLKNTKDPELKDKPVRYLAVGSSLTAGVRDGGYFNEGILTSYPNLIARQLKLAKFQMPLFDAQDYNGSGRKVKTSYNPTGGPLPKFKQTSNNLGVEEAGGGKIRFKKYTGGYGEDLDHWGVPKSDLATMEFGGNSIDQYYLERISYKDKKPFKKQYDALLEQTCDFFTLELGSQGWTSDQVLRSGRPNLPFESGEAFVADQFKKGAKGCIANIPYFYEFPFYNQVKFEDIQNAVLNAPFNFPANREAKIKPVSRIDSLLSPIVHIGLKTLSFYPNELAGGTNSGIDIVNQYNVEFLAKKYNYPIVDLNGLYRNILKGNYVTEDGVRVDPKLGGNFFSSDGIYPTAFGQAVIANEVIKALNKFYKMQIPLINTREYLDIL